MSEEELRSLNKELAATNRRLRSRIRELERRVDEHAALMELLREAGVIANAASSVHDALCSAIEHLCRAGEWDLGHAWLRRDKHGAFVDTGIWCPEDETRFRPRLEASSSAFLEDGSLLDRVVRTREPLQIDDLGKSSGFVRGRAAAEAGLRSALLIPIRVQQQVAGVIELYSSRRQSREREPLLRVMADVGTQLGRVIERQQRNREIAELGDQAQLRLAEQLHDRIGQQMAGVAMTARMLRTELPQGRGPSRDALTRLLDGVDNALRQLRALARGLIPLDVETQDLRAALDTLARRMEQTSGVRCLLECERPVNLQDTAIATHLLRIAQEAIQNAVDHAGARSIVVRLAAGDGVLLEIRDDGRGMGRRRTGGAGQKIMQHRARVIGADLRIESTPDGTAIRILLPSSTSPR